MSASHRLVTVLVLCGLCVVASAQGVFHVSSSAGGPGSGTAADPFPSIQTAINAAAAGDAVLVHAGTYFETIDFGGLDIEVRSAAGAASTTIDAAQTGPVVRFVSGESPAAVLRGFTLEGGLAANGGGITCEFASSPTIHRCVIRDNEAGVSGGGVHVTGGSSPKFIDCDINDNLAQISGGAIVAHNTALRLENCRLVGNIAIVGGGGAISIASSSGALIADCVMEENFAGDAGGAIDMFFTTLTIERTRIAGNSGLLGGGIHSFNSTPTIRRCRIVGNTAAGTGGGVHSSNGAPVLRDSALLFNEASDGGGLHESLGSSASMVGCTFAGNVATGGGGAVGFGGAGNPVYANSIFWANIPDGIAAFAGASLSVSFCDVQGGIAGPGNIASDPLLVDLAAADIALSAASPCIDAGSSTPVSTVTDLDGNPRTFGAGVDIGADERVPLLTGTGDDLSFAVLIDGRDGGVRTKQVQAGQALRFEIATPGGALSGIPPLILGQAFAPATPPVGPLPELHLDFPGLAVFFDGTSVPAPFGPVRLAADPIVLTAVAPALVGVVVRSQAVVASGLALNGIYATSDAFDLIFP